MAAADLRMPGMDGISLLYLIRQSAPEIVRVLLTGDGYPAPAIAAVNQGIVFRFLTKPCPPSALIGELNASVEQYRWAQRGANGRSTRPRYSRDFFSERVPSQGSLQ